MAKKSNKRKINKVLNGEEENGRAVKKKKYDLTAVQALLVDADPDYIEAEWIASEENLNEFNTRIFNALEADNYPKTKSSNNAKTPAVNNKTEVKPSKFTFAEPEILFKIPEFNENVDSDVYNFYAEGVILTCECCYDEEVKLPDTVECDKGLHTFCKKCFIKCSEQTIAKAEAYPKCMADCKGSFTDKTLREVLPEHLLKSLLQRQQQAEINKAEIHGLESCPFCYFAYVPPLDDPEFVCQNPECGKKSCRKCRKISHAPRKCKEDEILEVNHKIEEAMTQELIVTCPRCSKGILKTDGCNKVTCVCGAYICFVCKQQINAHNPYLHFDQYINGKICQLHTHTTRTPAEIKAAGEKVRDAELRKNPGVKLNKDPTKFVVPRKR